MPFLLWITGFTTTRLLRERTLCITGVTYQTVSFLHALPDIQTSEGKDVMYYRSNLPDCVPSSCTSRLLRERMLCITGITNQTMSFLDALPDSWWKWVTYQTVSFLFCAMPLTSETLVGNCGCDVLWCTWRQVGSTPGQCTESVWWLVAASSDTASTTNSDAASDWTIRSGLLTCYISNNCSLSGCVLVPETTFTRSLAVHMAGFSTAN